jgi:hypothetical protein
MIIDLPYNTGLLIVLGLIIVPVVQIVAKTIVQLNDKKKRK